jgi:peptidoglycan/xylan/chitin deacetylase (PgdA/CDA1 family)
MNKFGKFVISLDFELQWGMLDHVTKDSPYRKNIKAVHDVIPKLLELFGKYDIHATFATVGLVFFENFRDLKAGLPQLKPNIEIHQ